MIIVTGGAGFIGSNLINLLTKDLKIKLFLLTGIIEKILIILIRL